MHTDRLSDEQVQWWAQRESISGTSISSVLAREVQEWRAMRCDTCKHWLPSTACRVLTMTAVLPDWFCADYTPKERWADDVE